MAERQARIVYRALEGWPYEPSSQQVTPFSAPWSSTVDLLRAEADHLHAKVVVIELDVARRAVRLDEQLRSDARPYSEKVRVSMATRRGALSWHTDLYRLPSWGALGWRENVRAVALTLQALRAVDRYGATSGAEQYRGFAAIEAGPATSTAWPSADAALAWMIEQAGATGADVARGRDAYRAAARRLHPDVGGDRATWDQLEAARELVQGTDLW